MRFFTFNKSHSSVFITLLFVVSVGSLYFFIYLPQNEKRVQEQRFRTLQTIDRNIHAKIDNSVALMNNLLSAYEKDAGKITEYVNAYSTEKFTLTVPVTRNSQQLIPREIVDSGYIITVNNTNQIITLKLQKQRSDGADTTIYEMTMQLTFDQFISFLLPENVFDQYVVFSNGEVVYETFYSGINSLSDTATAKSSGFAASTVRSMNVSGRDYKLFSRQVRFTADQKWVLGGLLENKRYQQEKNMLPSHVVLLLVTVMLVIIVAFPWIKLYQMGNKDRLTVSDGIASIVVAMLLMSLLFFSFFKYNRYLRPVDSPDSKEVLAGQITTALQDEVDDIYRKLRLADSMVAANSSYFTDISKLHKMDSSPTGLTAKELLALNSIVEDTSISQVFWLKENGDEEVNWIAADMNAPHGNFKNRNYFKKIVEKKGYMLNNDNSKPYYLDQVTSWTSGKFTSVLSVPSVAPGQVVAALSFNMRSLHRPVLPTGYQFAIVDNAAQVLYHSDVSHNLNENLLNEFSSDEKLTSCMRARTRDVFTTKYYSKEYNILFKPLNRLPYSIIIFSDLDYKAARDMEIYSFTISMLMLLFLVLILQLLVVFLLSSKRSLFKKQFFDTSWIGPKISSHDEYNIAIIFNLVMILLAILFFNISAFLAYVYILLFSVTFISVFLNSLFEKRYAITKQHDNRKFKRTSILGLVIFILILNVTALKTLDRDSTFIFYFYELLAFTAAELLYFTGDAVVAQILKLFNQPPEKWNYTKSFALMSLTRLVITSGIPVAFFYISSYNYEQNISIRYRQLQYADQLVDKLPNYPVQKLNSNNTHFSRGFYHDSAWIKEFTPISNPDPERYSEEDTITAKILGLFRVNFASISIDDNKFYLSQASDSSFFYNPLLKDACKKNGVTITHRQTTTPGEYLKVTASSLNYRLPAVYGAFAFNGLLFWLMLLIALVAFYFIISNILNKLFCLRLHDLSLWKALDEKILTNKNLNNLVFIIGLPGSGKLTRIKEKIHKGEMLDGELPFILNEDTPQLNNVYIADLINIPDHGDEKERNDACEKFTANIFDKQIKLIIVNHFEYNIQDPVTNRIKLNFLEQLMIKSKSKVIILSTIHPVAFLDSFIDQVRLEGSKSIPGEDLERWHVLLGHYRIVVLPLDQSSPAQTDHSWYSIYAETEHTHFLKKIQDCAIDIAKKIPLHERSAKADQLAFKLQVTSHYFYMYIWQSLTKEEKFLLYDLAEDNLVNSFDDYNLNMLLAKGVIMRVDGSLQLFNKGFRNFILTAIGNTEAMKIKSRINDNGNWNSLKTPLLIVLVAILTFLLTFQEESYSKIIAYVAALGTGIPTVLKLFSVFDRNKPAKE